MRRFYLLLLLLAGPVLAQALQIYKQHDFQISYPSDWEIRPANFAMAVFLYPGQNVGNPAQENFNVQIDKLSQNMAFDMFCFMARHNIEDAHPDLKLVKSSTVNLGKLKAQRFDWAGKDAGRDLQIVQVMAVKGELGYTLTFCATGPNYKRFSSQAEAMIRSFSPL